MQEGRPKQTQPDCSACFLSKTSKQPVFLVSPQVRVCTELSMSCTIRSLEEEKLVSNLLYLIWTLVLCGFVPIQWSPFSCSQGSDVQQFLRDSRQLVEEKRHGQEAQTSPKPRDSRLAWRCAVINCDNCQLPEGEDRVSTVDVNFFWDFFAAARLKLFSVNLRFSLQLSAGPLNQERGF